MKSCPLQSINQWLDVLNDYNHKVLLKSCPSFFWVQFVIIKNNFTIIKLSQMISHMSFMTNGWNVPHHVLNNLFVMTLGLLIIFVLYNWILIINLIIYLKIFSNVKWLQSKVYLFEMTHCVWFDKNQNYVCSFWFQKLVI